MNAARAIDISRAWVKAQAPRIPGFCAGHLMGSLWGMPPEAEFPATGDVDFNLIVAQDQPTETFNIPWQGLTLEYSVVSRSRYATPETVLADPELACNLRGEPGRHGDGILADVDGAFHALQREVSRRYGERQWVAARCAAERRTAGGFLAVLERTEDAGEAAFAANGLVLFLSGLLAVADGLAPTHRRCLVHMHERLAAHGRRDLYADTLDLLGFARFTPAQARGYLADCAAAFDRAVQVRRSPCMFPFKFQPHARPYVIEGPAEMIAEGCHREAMLWIEGWIVFSNVVIQVDAPEAERPAYRERLDALRAAKGYGPESLGQRREQAHRLAEDVYRLCER